MSTKTRGRKPASRWALQDLELFKVLSRQQLEALTPPPTVELLESRFPVIVDDDAVRIIAAGGIKLTRVSATGRKLIVALLGPGDVFGRTTDGEPEDSHIFEPLEDSEVIVISRCSFEKLFQNTEFAYTVVQKLENRERQLVRRVESLVFKDVRTRLIETILELSERHGEACVHGMAVDVRITQQDLADLIGASRQMVNRILGELSRSLHVRRMGKVLCILNKARLLKLVREG